MKIPLQITSRGLTPISSVESLIVERSNRLERYCDHIIRCHVVIGLAHRHRCNGRRYSVHIDITTPVGNVVVTREPGNGAAELDVAIRDAFDAATRQLDGEARRRRSGWNAVSRW
jgi:ribosome-associated translation inhibitor RaiA